MRELPMRLAAHWNRTYLAAAYELALPVGLERESHSRSTGLRTFPLVAVASCAYMLLGSNVLESSDAEARVFVGIIIGMGFIGGGAILKSRNRTSGAATAASLWATGAIGVAVVCGIASRLPCFSPSSPSPACACSHRRSRHSMVLRTDKIGRTTGAGRTRRAVAGATCGRESLSGNENATD